MKSANGVVGALVDSYARPHFEAGARSGTVVRCTPFDARACGVRRPPRRPLNEEHELAVAAFLRTCDPEAIAALAAWPVLSERQMRRRQEREIPCGDENDLQIVGSRTREGYAKPVH